MRLLLLILPVTGLILSCRKPVEQGRTVTASGRVWDPVKNKPLPYAKVYLYGAHQNLYGIYYSNGPYDSVTADQAGNFYLNYTAEGESVDYALSVGHINLGWISYGQSNYVPDKNNPVYRLQFKTSVSGIVLPARELNYTRISLRVGSNPFDSFYLKSSGFRVPVLLIGQSIDTVILLRHLPNEINYFDFYTNSLRDTAGLNALNSIPGGRIYSVRRLVRDTVFANMSDTMLLNRSIPAVTGMPRD